MLAASACARRSARSRHLAGEGAVIGIAGGRKPRSRCASTGAGSRRGSTTSGSGDAFGGADDGRDDHGQLMRSLLALVRHTCLRRQRKEHAGPRLVGAIAPRRGSAASAASSGGMPVTWTRIQYMKTGASRLAQHPGIAGRRRDNGIGKPGRTIRRNSWDGATSATAGVADAALVGGIVAGSATIARPPAPHQKCRSAGSAAPRKVLRAATWSPGACAATKIANTSGTEPSAWFCRKMNIRRGAFRPHSLRKGGIARVVGDPGRADGDVGAKPERPQRHEGRDQPLPRVGRLRPRPARAHCRRRSDRPRKSRSYRPSRNCRCSAAPPRQAPSEPQATVR